MGPKALFSVVRPLHQEFRNNGCIMRTEEYVAVIIDWGT